jgi:Bacterial fructose-1,6-bisphosphatase, glpX-encoded
VNPRAVSLNRSTRSNIQAVAEAQGEQSWKFHNYISYQVSSTASHGLCARPLVTTDLRPGTIQTTLFWTPGRGIGDVTVVILDRPRHEAIIRECRETGCRIKLISDGDVAAAIEVAKAGAAADIMMGIGGTPEGKWPSSAVS